MVSRELVGKFEISDKFTKSTKSFFELELFLSFVCFLGIFNGEIFLNDADSWSQKLILCIFARRKVGGKIDNFCTFRCTKNDKYDFIHFWSDLALRT